MVRHIPILLLSCLSLQIIAEEGVSHELSTSPAVHTVSTVSSSVTPGGKNTLERPSITTSQDVAQRQEMLKKRGEIFQRMSVLRQTAMKDPEIIRLREDLIKAQKAFQTKLDSLMTSQPGYIEDKAQLDALNQQLGGNTAGVGMLPGNPPRGISGNNSPSPATVSPSKP